MYILTEDSQHLTAEDGIHLKSSRPWWACDSLDLEDCIVAYQALGIDSFAASRVNLAHPGRYDLEVIDGIVEPGWAKAEGWVFADHGLNTRLRIPSSEHQWSIMVRYSDATFSSGGNVPAGCETATGPNWGGCLIYIDDANIYLVNNGVANKAFATPTAGVLGIAGDKGYSDGTDLSLTIPSGLGNLQKDIYFGRNNYASGPYPFQGKIQAIAWWNVTLTPTQVTEITNRMNALSTGSIKPLTALVNYVNQKLGSLVCWNMPTFVNTETANPDLDPNTFAPTDLDINNWMDAIISAGCKYAILTAKHHDGFALWPTDYAVAGHDPYSIAQTDWYANNGNPDVVGQFVSACSSHSLNPGIYFSIIDWTYETRSGTDEVSDPAAYVVMIKAQLTELLTNYGTIGILWLDGWQNYMGMSHIHWSTIYEFVKSISPSTIVVHNAGLHPSYVSEIETYEQVETPIADGNTRLSEAAQSARIDGKWFYCATADQTSSAYNLSAIQAAIAQANDNNGAFLLASSPDKSGHLPAAQVTIYGQIPT